MFSLFSLTRLTLVCSLLAAGLWGTGCASVTRGTKDKLKVVSEPPGALVTLSNGKTGTTPATFKLSRKKDLVVEVSKPGYETQKVVVVSKFSGTGGVALAGNVLIGGLIGAGIDGLSGATLSLKPNPVTVTLVSLETDAPEPISILDSNVAGLHSTGSEPKAVANVTDAGKP